MNNLSDNIHEGISISNEEILHPLQPLSKLEISTASAIVKNSLGENAEKFKFETIELVEPLAEETKSTGGADSSERKARVVIFPRGELGVIIYEVSLSEKTIESKKRLPTARPMIQLEEFLEIENAVKTDKRFIDACKKRGILNLDLVCVDPWSAGSLGEAWEDGRHVSHTFAWIRNSPEDNLYAHPIEGLNATVDISKLEVLSVVDTSSIPIPKASSNYATKFQETLRADLKPINITQPKGVSFKFTDGKIVWDKWSMVIGFNAREGLTLHEISYDERSICKRASIAEMVVPYGSPDPAHARKNVFDIGEYGLGKLTNSLKLGCDCLGAIQYLDCWVADINGEPMKIENGICIHEEDFGVLWKHYDYRINETEVRRSRRLVVSSFATVGNYEYGSFWYFYLDGEIEFEMKATGIINTVGCEPHKGNKYGTEVSPGVLGQNHQHIFCARLEMSVDGQDNSVFECDTVAEPPGENNPYGNAFYIRETPIEFEGGRKTDEDKHRYWKFCSNKKTNFMGKPTGYKLEPTHRVSMFHDPGSPSGGRMGFAFKDLWLTPFDQEERYPAGDFVNMSNSGEGLPEYAKKSRTLSGKSIVAWHSFGLHHMPRLEDYPVQPVIRCGFKLMPVGFFDRNPGIDLAPETNEASCRTNIASDGL